MMEQALPAQELDEFTRVSSFKEQSIRPVS